MLRHTVGEVHNLAASQRGHYLAQLLTRWFSDGTLSWQRFRLAHLLATYYSMMPTQQTHLGALDTSGDDLTLLAWATTYGEVLDVVHVFRQRDQFVDEDVQHAIALGRRRWPETFLGVRYLPLEDLSDARFYKASGIWQSVVERDLLHLI